MPEVLEKPLIKDKLETMVNIVSTDYYQSPRETTTNVELAEAYRKYNSGKHYDYFVFDGVKVTLDEYLDLPEGDHNYEYVDGRCKAKDMARMKHQLIGEWLLELMVGYLRASDLGNITLMELEYSK